MLFFVVCPARRIFSTLRTTRFIMAAAAASEMRCVNNVRVLSADIVEKCVACQPPRPRRPSRRGRPRPHARLLHTLPPPPRAQGQVRPPWRAHGLRAHCARALWQGHALRPQEPQVGRPRPLCAVQWPRQRAAVLHAAPHWLRPAHGAAAGALGVWARAALAQLGVGGGTARAALAARPTERTPPASPAPAPSSFPPSSPLPRNSASCTP